MPRRLSWPWLIAGLALLALLLMVWRWGGTVEDSQAYFDTARYLRGELAFQELRAPFPYRLLVPALAAALPGDLRQGFATLNWVLVTAAACLLVRVAQRAGLGNRRALAAGLLMTLSLPTFWYAPYLLVDPGSVCARSAFVLVWLVAMGRIAVVPGLCALAAAGGWIVAVRWFLLPGLPGYVWSPSWWTVNHALRDLRSLLSIAGTAILVVPLAVAGWRAAPRALRPFASLALLMALPACYATLSVRVDGRIVWGLYPFLVPFAVSVGWRAAQAQPGVVTRDETMAA